MPGWQPTHFTRAQLEERRLAAVEWIKRGTNKNQEIADHFGVSVHTVYSWKARLGRKGTLTATVASGPTSRLTADQRE
uniref:helix-turn-helix domain-containing protein n=1 Tax=Deinococcus sp. TaxID=47478 RepID=UPI002869BB90